MYRFLECKAGQYMARDVVTVTKDVTLRELEALFAEGDFNAFPVMEDGQMVGIVTKFDFLKAFAFTTHEIVPHYDERMSVTVGSVMTEAVVDVQPHVPLTRVADFGQKRMFLPPHSNAFRPTTVRTPMAEAGAAGGE